MNRPATKSSFKIPPALFHVCRFILGLIFIIASVDKISEPWNFGRAVYAYRFLPGFLISPFTVIVPWVELISGLLLVLNRFTRPAAILVGLLNISFIIAILSVAVRGMTVECGCGLDVGPLAAVVGTQADGWAVLRDLVFLAMAWITFAGAGPDAGQGGK